MKNVRFILGASIAVALAGSLMACPLDATDASSSVASGEAARITQTVNAHVLSVMPDTHLKFIEHLSPSTTLPDSFTMNHLQLVLKPSAARQAALTTLIASQHDPKSSGFRQWLTPAQFGNRYGVADSDIATVTAWLTAQGFTVNQVYPNKAQIDFSGTVGAVRAAFHTGIGVYQLGKSQVQIPVATAPHSGDD